MKKLEEIKSIYNAFYNPEKTEEKMVIYIGGEFNEPYAKEANIGLFNTDTEEGIAILEWARKQENVEIVSNARW